MESFASKVIMFNLYPKGHTNWKLFQTLIYLVLPIFITTNFYGLYTQKFYWNKFDNYILPVVSLVHLVYVSYLNTKIKSNGKVDFRLQNLEFATYGVLVIYLFESIETLTVMMDSSTFNQGLVPKEFLFHGGLIFSIQITFSLLTLSTFFCRKKRVGTFNFDQIENNLEGWRSVNSRLHSINHE